MTKERFDSVLEISRQEYDDFAANKELSRSFVANGNDLLAMLRNVAYGVYRAWDVRCIYTQFLKDQYTVHPTQSLVQNIGCDGTGMHCDSTDMYEVTLSDKTKFRFPEEPIVDPRIVKANLKFNNRRTFKQLRSRAENRVRGLFKRMFG